MKTLLLVAVAFGAGFIIGNRLKKIQSLCNMSLEELQMKMKEFVEKEDYTSAALVRDTISKKKKETA